MQGKGRKSLFRSRTLKLVQEAKRKDIDYQDDSTDYISDTTDDYVPDSTSCDDDPDDFSKTYYEWVSNKTASDATDISTIITYSQEDNLVEYSKTSVLNFSHHLKRQHSDELEVQKYLNLNINDPQRKYLISKIRKEGDFVTGEITPVLRHNTGGENLDNVSENSLLPCVFCKGYYAKSSLRRHVKRCHFNNRDPSIRVRHQSQSQNLMVHHFGPNDPLRTSGVLDSLNPDEISLVAKRDKIICEVGRLYVKSHKDKHLIGVAKRYTRRLARLLMEARTIENDNKLTLIAVSHRSKFKTIVAATRKIAQYNTETKSFTFPSLALQMGTIIKKAINAAYSLEVQNNVESPLINILEAMKNLIDAQWTVEVSSEAGQNLHVNRFNKPSVMILWQKT